MPYTLVGAPAVGFDLARLAGGGRVAEVLRVAVTAGPETLAALAAQHPGAVRDTWQVSCGRALAPEPDDDGTRGTGPPSESLTSVLPAVEGSLRDPSDSRDVLARLESGLLGDLAALRRLVRDVLVLPAAADGAGHREATLAADVLVDAATAAYVGDRLPEELRRAMGRGLVAARVPARDETVPTGVPVLDARLARLAEADEGLRTAWRAAVAARRPDASWAPAMHEASWALSLTDRLRLAFDAQMAAAGVFGRAGFTPRDAAYGVWNALSGVVQASLVEDVLPSGPADVLLAPWRAVHGG